jgi:aflatoxin B1 aldehyde reductase
LAGGFLTGKVTFPDETASPGGADSENLVRTRWRGASTHGFYTRVFDQNPAMHEAVRALKAACDSQSPPIPLGEAAMRWTVHHSALQDGDAVIFGATSLEMLEGNVADVHRGPLPDGIREAIDDLYKLTQGETSSF